MNKEIIEEEEIMSGHAPCSTEREGVLLTAANEAPGGDLNSILKSATKVSHTDASRCCSSDQSQE